MKAMKVTKIKHSYLCNIITASSASETITSDSRRVTLYDTSRGRFYPSSWNGTWINDKEFIYSGMLGSLNIYNVQAQNVTQLMSPAKMSHFSPWEYKLSADKSYLLIKRTHKQVFRRSSIGTYAIISLHDLVLTPLKPSSDSEVNPEDFLIRYVSWSPKGNSLVYVDIDNNVIIKYQTVKRVFCPF